MERRRIHPKHSPAGEARRRYRVNLSLSQDDYEWLMRIARIAGVTPSGAAGAFVRFLYDAAAERYSMLDADQAEALRRGLPCGG